jgi:hypothetical protein
MNANEIAADLAKRFNISLPLARAIVAAGVEAFCEVQGRPDLAAQVKARFSK